MINYNNIINNNNFNDNKLQNKKKIVINSRCRNDLLENTNDFVYDIDTKFEYVKNLELIKHNINMENSLINNNNNTFEIYSSNFEYIDDNILADKVYLQELLINKIHKGIEKILFKKKKIYIENGNYTFDELSHIIQNQIRFATKNYERIIYDKSENKFIFYNIPLNYSNDDEDAIKILDNNNLKKKNIFMMNFNNYIKNINYYEIFNITNIDHNDFNIVSDKILHVFYDLFEKFYPNNNDILNDNYSKLYKISDVDEHNLFNKLLQNLLIYYINNTNKINSNNNDNILILYDNNNILLENQYIYQNISLNKLKNIINNYIFEDTILKDNLVYIINQYTDINQKNYIYIDDIYEHTDINNNIIINIFNILDTENILNISNLNDDNELFIFINNINDKNNLKTYENITINFNIDYNKLYNKLRYNNNIISNYFSENFNNTYNYYFYIFNTINDDINDITYYNEGYKISYILGFIKDIIYFANKNTYIFKSNISPNDIYNEYICISFNNYYNNYYLKFIDNNIDKNITFIINNKDPNMNILRIEFPYSIHIEKLVKIQLYNQFGNMIQTNYKDFILYLNCDI